MNAVTTELEVNVAQIEQFNEEAQVLGAEQLAMIAGGQCTTNSI